jgi:hypothetical protein
MVANTLNTLIQTYFARFILSGKTMSSLSSDFSSVFSSGSNFFGSAPISGTYYVEIGVILAAVLLIEVFFPHIYNLFYRSLKRSIALASVKKSTKSERFIQDIFLDYRADFEINFAKLGYYLIIGFGLAGGMPLLHVWAFIFLISFYFAERSLFLSQSVVPFFAKRSIMCTTLKAGYFALVVRSITSFYALTDPSIFPHFYKTSIIPLDFSQIFGKSIIRFDSSITHFLVVIACIVLYLVILFAVPCCKAAKETREQFLKRHVDSAALHFEEDEIKDNILAHKTAILSYTLPTYSWFKNAEWAEMKSHFFIDILPTDGPQELSSDDPDGTVKDLKIGTFI